MRRDLEIIANLIKPGARVLDLGCGEGELLQHLQNNRDVKGYGLEIEHTKITTCINKGVNVIEQDLDKGLDNFPSDSFDMAIMTETLQAVKRPDYLIDDMLRVADQCIITFPNFGHWKCRLYLATKGAMPVAGHLPHAWYSTPNIHLCTFKDFEDMCRSKRLEIIDRFVVDTHYVSRRLANAFPNIFGHIAFYRLRKQAQCR